MTDEVTMTPEAYEAMLLRLEQKRAENLATTLVSGLRIAMTPPPLSQESVWVGAWNAVASAWNCSDKEAPARWADQAVKDYVRRFGAK